MAGFSISGTAPENLGFSAGRLAAIAPAMQAAVDARTVPNVGYAVARDGQLVCRGSLGFHDIADGRPVADDTIFRVASMTKGVTGVAAMIAYDDGCFGLDDPVSDYLPEFADMQVWTPQGLVAAERPITVRHLLTHTSGLTSGFLPGPVPDMYLERNLQDGMLEGTLHTLDEYSRLLAELPLICQPGAEWNYGEGLAIMGRLIEVVSGQRYGDFLEARLFAPLGMVDTGFYVPRPKWDRLATLYGVDFATGKVAEYKQMFFPAKQVDRPFHPMNMHERPKADLGGAGLVSTVEDTLRFAMMLANRGEAGGVRILAPETADLVCSGQLVGRLGDRALARSILGERGLGMDMGLGVLVVRDSQGSGHAASPGTVTFSGATGARFWADPVLNIAGVFFTHAMNGGLMEFSSFERLVYAAREPSAAATSATS